MDKQTFKKIGDKIEITEVKYVDIKELEHKLANLESEKTLIVNTYNLQIENINNNIINLQEKLGQIKK